MMQTPFSTEVALVGDVVRITVMLSTDAGPVREFRPFLDVDLDDGHALELLGSLSIALEQRRADREAEARAITARNVVRFPGREGLNG